MAEITASPERLERYAEVAVAALDLNVLRAHDRLVADEMAAKFMAVADAEQAELAQLWLEQRSRADAAEAAIARVEAMADEWELGYNSPTASSWAAVYARLLRDAMADPERHVCPECEQGKHANCDGTAWDDAKDEPTSCTCLHETDDEAELGRLHDEGEAP